MLYYLSTMLDILHIHLKDRDPDMICAWRDIFADYHNVTITHGSIFPETADAIISPANSFGFMDGGIDLVYSQWFGWHVESRVRARILDTFDGELPVGQATIVATDHDAIPYLICAPTMRVPMEVTRRVHAYLAFRAALRAVKAHNRIGAQPPIRTLLCPGLGTGVGCLDPTLCALQMRRAYNAICQGQVLRKGGLAAAVRDHMELLGMEPP